MQGEATTVNPSWAVTEREPGGDVRQTPEDGAGAVHGRAGRRAGGIRSRRRSNDGERGAALIEFAIVAPVLFALLLGMVTGGVSLSRKNSMTNSVREAGRLGATLTEDPAWAEVVRTRAVDLSGGDLTASQVCVTLVRAPSTVVRASGCASELASSAPSLARIPAGDCAVLVWAGRTSTLQAIFFTKDLDLEAESVSRYERECP